MLSNVFIFIIVLICVGLSSIVILISGPSNYSRILCCDYVVRIIFELCPTKKKKKCSAEEIASSPTRLKKNKIQNNKIYYYYYNKILVYTLVI